MAVKLKNIEFRTFELGSDNSRSATAYFSDYQLEFKTIDTAKNLVELMKGIKLRVNFGSLEVPDDKNRWTYTTPDNVTIPLPANLKAELISWYKDYLNFELVLENPVVDDRGDYYFHLSDSNALRVNFSKNPNEDDPLMIWLPIDIRDIPGFEEVKDELWQSYDTNENEEYVGMRPRWDKKHYTDSVFNEETNEWSATIHNPLNLYLNGYSVDISFKCFFEGEISEN